MKLVEMVPNFSDGRNKDTITLLENAVKETQDAKLLDTEMDYDHNRSVITIVVTLERAAGLAYRLIQIASENIDMGTHTGAHPRFGATDVMPFIPLEDTTMDECVKISHEVGKLVGEKLGIPVFMYANSALSPERTSLENIRNKSFQIEQLRESIGSGRYIPDYGPSIVGSAGATIIGARDILVAWNIYLNTDNIHVGRKIASAIRGRDGGFAYVKSLALFIQEKKMVQISMNLVNYRKNPLYRIFQAVKAEASRYGISIAGSEFIGMVPREALVESFNYYMMSDLKNNNVLDFHAGKI
ncbi:MAG: glutamate formimidoyltransferase [Ferroplasma sp.]|uniref:glutamate formimidoyltransferase n=1 Tax=Ferroplasma sp. TaxID=2591003 RepID=UPI002815585C|nr:glutamate formimidoyltransferase [Ferroplasma sp.]WMT51075.1 MAG: glutamate formimidoyltransferase [Ferroplasma sp.]